MKKLMIGAAIIALTLGSAAGASISSTRYKGHELAKTVKITLVKARAAALKARPGKIIDQELEKEQGGSGMRYSFDIRSKGKAIEVGIDAMTGAVLKNGAENKGKEAKETAMEKKH
ncbi:MAG: PepSY domain-containing protein [Novosphingobium sp.]